MATKHSILLGCVVIDLCEVHEELVPQECNRFFCLFVDLLGVCDFLSEITCKYHLHVLVHGGARLLTGRVRTDVHPSEVLIQLKQLILVDREPIAHQMLIGLSAIVLLLPSLLIIHTTFCREGSIHWGKKARVLIECASVDDLLIVILLVILHVDDLIIKHWLCSCLVSAWGL